MVCESNQASQRKVFEIAILGRAKWNLHSLNNEGSIGNVTEPRTVVLWDGTRTDGVSGEMMKHIHAYWTWLAAMGSSSPQLCEACKPFRPQRADARRQNFQNKSAKDALNNAIGECVLCDLHGFLVQKPAIHRQSTVEFGWVVGLRDAFYWDIHVHARHAMGDSDQTGAENQAQSEDDEARQKTAQMVYHRPTRSGVYALVTLFQPWRIGLNEVDYTYVPNDTERTNRYKLALTAYEWTLKRPYGAMTSTRLPHIEGVEGIVLIAEKPTPVPLLSPLQEDYREKLQSLAQEQGVESRPFQDLNELLTILKDLTGRTPFRMPFANAQESNQSTPAEAQNQEEKPESGRKTDEG